MNSAIISKKINTNVGEVAIAIHFDFQNELFSKSNMKVMIWTPKGYKAFNNKKGVYLLDKRDDLSRLGSFNIWLTKNKKSHKINKEQDILCEAFNNDFALNSYELLIALRPSPSNESQQEEIFKNWVKKNKFEIIFFN